MRHGSRRLAIPKMSCPERASSPSRPASSGIRSSTRGSVFDTRVSAPYGVVSDLSSLRRRAASLEQIGQASRESGWRAGARGWRQHLPGAPGTSGVAAAFFPRLVSCGPTWCACAIRHRPGWLRRPCLVRRRSMLGGSRSASQIWDCSAGNDCGRSAIPTWLRLPMAKNISFRNRWRSGLTRIFFGHGGAPPGRACGRNRGSG
jgi:hypothetical protein